MNINKNNNCSIDYSSRYGYITAYLYTEALINLLVNKGIISEEDSNKLDDIFEELSQSDDMKETFNNLELLSYLQRIKENRIFTDENEEYIREKAKNLVTEEQMEDIISSLRTINEQTDIDLPYTLFKSIFSSSNIED